MRQRDLGIKQRGSGGVEIKGLIVRRDTAVSFTGLAAPLEIWGKWSANTLDLSGMRLLPISKQRWMRRFQCTPTEMREWSAEEDSCKQHVPDCNCEIEFTRLAGPDGKVWLSGGFVTFL